MEFFELGIGRIHQLISDCFALASLRGLWFALSGLFLSLLILYFCKKYRVFIRHTRLTKAIVKSYNFYLPFLFTLGGFSIGVSLATKDFFAKETKTSISPLMKLVFPAYQSHINTYWDRVVQTRMSFTETVDEYVGEIKFVPRNEEFMELIFTKTSNLMVPKITKWGIESIVTAAKEISLKQSEEQGYIETGKVKALLIAHSLSMFNYPPGIWDLANTKLEEKAVYYFRGIAGNIFFLFLVLLLFPFVENLLYHLYSKKKFQNTGGGKGNVKSGNSGKNGNSTEIIKEFERVSKEKTPVTSIEIEIPKLFEN